MSSCLSRKWALRLIVSGAPALFGLVLLSGCDDKYAEDMTYPSRTDPLITASLHAIDANSLSFDKPGEFDRPDGQFSNLLKNVDPDERRNNIIDPTALKPAQRKEIEKALEAVFGTPRKPKADFKIAASEPPFDEETLEKYRDTLKLNNDEALSAGSQLYRIHCLHCHGLTGNGRGPTAPWVHPHPRDYRQGIFKFTSVVGQSGKPRRDDLLRTLREGLEGTSMPSFGLLPEEDLQNLASYVIHLSIRGQVEFQTIERLVKSKEEVDIQDLANRRVGQVAKLWQAAHDNPIRPEGRLPTGEQERKESAIRGHKLVQTVGCMTCHIDYGRDGDFHIDVWGTVVRAPDLTLGVYRGGRRPIDLYWRLHSGITGGEMPSSGRTPQEIWDIINFLQVLPYPQMLKEYGIDIK